MPFNKADILIKTKGSSFSKDDFEVDIPSPGLYGGMNDKAEIESVAKEVFGLSTELSIPLDIIEHNYNEMSEIADPDDVPEVEFEFGTEEEKERPLVIAAAPEEKSLLKSIFGYEGLAKPGYYWNMNPIKRAAFDFYMAGRHILTRLGGKIVTETGLAKTKEIHDLYNDELANNPKWYQKSPELLGWSAEKAAEFYALSGLFKVTGLHRVLNVAGQKLAKPFLTTAIVARGGQQTLKTLSKAGLKRLGKDSLVAFLRFAPENTAFLTTWSVAGAALKDEDKTEAAWAGALWGAGLSVLTPAVGGIGKIFIATKAGAKVQMAARRAYTELWRKFPRLMNAGRKPFSDEFLTESKKQFRERFGIEPTGADTAKLKKITRMVADEINKAAEKEAALRAYWNSGAKKAQEAAKAPVKPTEIVKKAPSKPVQPPKVVKPPAVAKKAIVEPAKPAAEGGVVIRAEGAEVNVTENVEKLSRENFVYRGMTQVEFDATVGKDGGVISRGDFRFAEEGTNFAEEFTDAESFIDFGRDDPRKTGKPTFIVEVEKGDNLTKTRRGDYEAKAEIPAEQIGRVWKIDAVGNELRAVEITQQAQPPAKPVKVEPSEAEITPTEPLEPLGLAREQVVDTSLKDLPDAEFEQIREQADAKIDSLEKQFDENVELENDSQFRKRLAEAQDRFVAAENENFRRDMIGRHIEDVAEEFMKLDLSVKRGKTRALILVGAVKERGATKEFQAELKKISAKSPDLKTITEDQLGKLRDLAKEADVARPKKAISPAKPATEVGAALQQKFEAKFDAELKKLGLFKAVKEGKAIGLPESKRQAILNLKKKLREEFQIEQVQPPAKLEKPPPQEPRLGPKGVGATTIIPDIVTEASETGKRLGSTIKGAIKGAKELASRNVLRYTTHLRGLGAEGKKVATDFDEITQRAQKRINNSNLDSATILKGVNKENREKIAKTINSRLKNPPKWIQERADKLRAVLDKLLNEAKKLGIQRRVGGTKMEIAGTGKAFPQVPNADGEKLLRHAGKPGNHPDVLFVAEEMVALGKANSVEEYITSLQHFRDSQLRGISGYLERQRVELPERFLEWDPDRVLSGLFQKNWLFIEGARQWGVDSAGLAFPKMAVQIEAVRAAHGSDEAKLLDQFVKAAFGRELLSSEASRKISAVVRGYQFLTKIAASPLTITRNILDRFNKVRSFAPLSVQLKTLKEYPPFINAFLKHSKEIEEEMIRRGAVFSNTAIGEGYQPGHLLTRLAGKAFATSELGNQVYIALAKKNAIDANLKLLRQNPKIAKIFDKRIGKLLSPLEALGKSPTQAVKRLRELGNEEILAKIQSVDDISPDLLDAILHKTVRDNAFPVVLSTKRSWWDNKPFVRMLTQFKVWGTEQIGHIWNDVIKDTVKHRDPSKLIGWIVSMAVTGEIYNILRDFILGKDESLLKTLSDAERRNAKDISVTILKNIIDGGAVGIFADIIYGLPNLIGGPTAQTLINMGDTTAKTIWNVTQAKDALKILAIKETPALRQTQALLDKIDARFNQKNLTQDYYKWRRKGWEWSHNKKFPSLGDKAKEQAIKSLLGWTRRIPQERTLSYEMITRNVLVGDTESASDFLFFLLKTADTPDKQDSIERGIQTALQKSSPLGNVSEEDLGEFFKSMTPEQRQSAIGLQLQWNVNASEAQSKAIRKWQEWNREQN